MPWVIFFLILLVIHKVFDMNMWNWVGAVIAFVVLFFVLVSVFAEA